MNRITEFAKSHPRIVVAVLLSVLVAAVLVIAIPMIGSSINEARIGKLEKEKQQLLKQVDEARARDLILQGKIQAKDEQIQNLTSQIADSNQRVFDAHTETVSARTNYDRVRSNPPKFNSADDAGRVVELQSDLRDLYRNSHDKP